MSADNVHTCDNECTGYRPDEDTWIDAAYGDGPNTYADRVEFRHSGLPGLIAATIAAERTDAARRVVQAVEALHIARSSIGDCWCDADGEDWPCRTVRAARAALERTNQ